VQVANKKPRKGIETLSFCASPILLHRKVANKKPRKGIETSHRVIQVIPAHPPVANKKPRKGIETPVIHIYHHVWKRYWLQTKSPVRGLKPLWRKQKRTFALRKLQTKSPVRGLKLDDKLSPGFQEGSVANKKPRKGIETFGPVGTGSPSALSVANKKPRKGIETRVCG